MAKAVELLKRYINKRTIYLTQRGNKSIFYALKIMKQLGKKKIIIQDQGGWITYPQYIEQLKLEKIELPTDYGIINPNSLSMMLDEHSVLLINSCSGYFADQPMSLLYSICKQKNALLINDCSGSIGTPNATIGDIIIGSFGRWKPINVEYGGFIAFDGKEFNSSILESATFEQSKLPLLEKKLIQLTKRLRDLDAIRMKVLRDLEDMNILHKDKKGLNVVIAFSDRAEKERVINYCIKNNLEWVECPQYYKVNIPAISIEIKRVKT